MTLAHVGVHVEHSAGEVAESQDVVALRSIHRNLAGLEGIAAQVFYDSLLSSELLDCRTGSAVLSITGTDTARKDECLLQFSIAASISQFTVGLMRNDGPTHQVVMSAYKIDAETDHVDRIATESESGIRIEFSDDEAEDPCPSGNDDPLPDLDLDDEAQQPAQQTALAPAVLPPSPNHLDFLRCIHRVGGNIFFFREIDTLDTIMPPRPPVVYSERAGEGVGGQVKKRIVQIRHILHFSHILK
jgi:hypothetical protein